MSTQLRDTQFGHVVRLLSNNRAFQYPDEEDVTLWKKALQPSDMLPMAQLAPRDDQSEQSKELNDHDRAKNVPCEPTGQTSTLRGEEVLVVGWYDADDPEVSRGRSRIAKAGLIEPKNPQNWPSRWKVLTALQINLLNFAIYIAR